MYYRMKTSDYKICSKCGRGFSTTFDCKTTMCPECYKIYRKEYMRRKAKDAYNKRKAGDQRNGKVNEG